MEKRERTNLDGQALLSTLYFVMTESNSTLKKYLTTFQGKKVLIRTKAGLLFTTSNVLVLEEGIKFTDKFRHCVYMDFSEISSVTEDNR